MTTEFREVHDTKFVRELNEYWNAYMYAIINEIYVGVSVALGMPRSQALKLARARPGSLSKAGFFKNIFEKFKSVFKHIIKPFYPRKINIKNATPERWDVFSQELRKYWKDHTDSVTEDVSIKGFLLGRNTSTYRREKKPYKNKSLFQISFEQYDGNIPNRIDRAYKKYNFDESEKNSFNRSFSEIAMHVKNVNDEIEEAIRQQVQKGIEENKSSTMIASDLYWNVEKDEKLLNKYTAETLRRNWNRVSTTELAMIYEAGVLSPHEAESMESLKNPRLAQYFVRIGGTCPWCISKQGTLARLVPKSIVTESGDESLRSMGINDPNTDIAIWIGKNNVGRKQAEWNICCPAHPHNVATFSIINIKDEYYNPKTQKIERRQEEKKFIPQASDYSELPKEERQVQRPVYVGDNMVRIGSNIYEAVDPDSYNIKLEAWRKNPLGPIPVNRAGPQYIRIFEQAKENK